MATVQEIPQVLNGVNVDDLFTTIDVIKETPAIAKFQFRFAMSGKGPARNRSLVNTFYGAGRELSRTKAFLVETDEPSVLLGKDRAPNPVEYLLHALAACLTTSMVYHAAARGIQIEEIESSFEGDLDLHGFLELDNNVRQGFQQIRANFKIKADAPDEQLQEIMKLGTGHSPVFDSLTNGVPISVTAERM